jgi:hypothetical protein
MREGFKGFVCWEPGKASKVVVVDAVDQSPAVFAATHSPVTGYKKAPGSAVGTPIGEDEVMREFLELDTELVLIPIIGESGTGKSRLVSWMRAHMPTDERFHLVYIPRYQTDLRSVIELILSGMEGANSRRLLDDLRTAVGSLNETTAPDRLLDALAIALQEVEARFKAGDPTATEQRMYLAKHLPDLLRDPFFRVHLLAENAAVVRLVREALTGRGIGDHNAPFQFTPDDLPSSVVGAGEASQMAQNVYRYLASNDELRLAAVELLNQELEKAVSSLFGLSARRLSEVMVEARQELQRAGKELVLLIEDFAILQGVQTELLDAIIEPRRESQLCRIRAAIAVTSGYLESLNTVKTRASFFVDLDVPLGGSAAAVSEGDLQLFVGRYLNASRLGVDYLDGTWSPNLTSGEVVPNHCHKCPFKEECHSSFGTDADERGLYPFNGAALQRAIDSVSEPGRFDPRAILRDLLLPVLRDHAPDLANGAFPSKRLNDRFANEYNVLDAQVSEDLRSLDPVNSERREILLTYWGDAPNAVVNLATGIHDAFDLPALERVEVVRPPEEGGEAGPEKPLAADLPRKVQDRLTQLNKWGQGQATLDQDLAREIRNALLQATEACLEDSPVRLDKNMVGTAGNVLRPASFMIDKAAGGAASSGDALRLTITPSTENALLFQGLMLHAHHGHWDFPRGHERLVAAQEAVAPLAAKAMERLTWAAEEGSDRLDQTLTILSLTGEILNRPHYEDAQRAIAVSLAPVSSTADDDHVSDLWRKLREIASSEIREKMRGEVLDLHAARKGTGGPLAVDAARLLSGLTKADEIKSFLQKPSPYKDVERLRSQLDRVLEAAIDEEIQSSQESLDVFKETIGGEREVPQLVKDLQEAFNSAMMAGIDIGFVSEKQELIERLGAADLSCLSEARAILSGESATIEDRMRIATRLRSRQLSELKTVAEKLDSAVSGALGSVEAQAGALKGDEAANLAAVEALNQALTLAVSALESLEDPHAG